jgi:hypothetical protein
MTNIVVHGKSGIRVEVVLHSISEAGQEIITFLRDYPRIVHAEDLKHRMFSNSAASSRAIPFAKMVQQLEGMPVRFGKNTSGMQDAGEHDANVEGDTWDTSSELDVTEMLAPEEAWYRAREDAIKWSERFNDAGFHKQISGRLTEPFQMIRVLTTATETDNFYWLRDDPAADPTLQELARCMREAHMQSVPQKLKAGEWHLPFVQYYQEVVGYTEDDVSVTGPQIFYVGKLAYDTLTDPAFQQLTLEEAIKVSCARCAATSFRNENYGLEKSLQVYDRLVNGDKIHAGALEHAATPMKYPQGLDECNGSCSGFSNEDWEVGISHMDRDGNLWSGNFKNWIQYRKTVKGECYVDKRY